MNSEIITARHKATADPSGICTEENERYSVDRRLERPNQMPSEADASLANIDNELSRIVAYSGGSDTDLNKALLLKHGKLLQVRAETLTRMNRSSEAKADAKKSIDIAQQLLKVAPKEMLPSARVLNINGIISLATASANLGNIPSAINTIMIARAEFMELQASLFYTNQHLDSENERTKSRLAAPSIYSELDVCEDRLAEAEDWLNKLERDRNNRATAELVEVKKAAESSSTQNRSTPDSKESTAEWTEIESELQRTIDQIAILIVRANTLVANAPNSDRFQDWLTRRLSDAVTTIKRSGFRHKAQSNEDLEVINAARHRGRTIRMGLLETEEFATAEAIASASSVQPIEVEKARLAGNILGVPNPNDESDYRYPTWQFAPHLQHWMPQLLALLDPLEPWAKWHFFHATSPILSERTPLNVLGLTPPGTEQASNLNRTSLAPENDKAGIELIARAVIHYMRGLE